MGEGRRIPLYCGLGGCLLAVAVALCFLRINFIRYAQSAEGVVDPSSAGENHVTVEFTTASGKKSWFITSGEVATHPGQKVRVLYREGLDPRWYRDGVDARMAAPASLWWLPLTLSIFGGGLLVVGVWGSSIDRMIGALRRSLRKRNHNPD